MNPGSARRARVEGRDVEGRVVEVGNLPEHGTVTVDLPVPASALAVAAHPDDAEFGCGGTLAKWAAAGAVVDHLVLTDGGGGTWDPSVDRADLVETRHREQRDAATLLGGGGVVFLDWPDGELEAGLAQRRQVCQVIRELRPEIVLGHDPWRRYRLHPDHRNAGWLVTDAVVAARDPMFFRDLGSPPHRAKAVMLWEADEPNHIEDVASTIDTKVAALLAHRSQYRSTMGFEDGEATTSAVATFRSRISRQLTHHGQLAGLQAGEAFRLLADI